MQSKLTERLGLKRDKKSGVYYGRYRGYHVSFSERTLILSLEIDEAENLNTRAVSYLEKTCGTTCGTHISPEFTADGATVVVEASDEGLSCLEAFFEFLEAEGIRNKCCVCNKTGTVGYKHLATQKGLLPICEACTARTQSPRGRILLGAIGCVFGIALGMLIMIGANIAGYVVSIAGVAMVFFGFRGYMMLSKGSPIVGFVLTTLLSLVAVYVGTWLFYYIEVYRANYSLSELSREAVSTVYTYGKHLLATDVELQAMMDEHLGQQFIYTVIGIGLTLFDFVKALRKEKVRVVA
ncbi:hypothetical protein ACR6HW_06705 [Fusibacter sp. JL298sf-3]